MVSKITTYQKGMQHVHLVLPQALTRLRGPSKAFKVVPNGMADPPVAKEENDERKKEV